LFCTGRSPVHGALHGRDDRAFCRRIPGLAGAGSGRLIPIADRHLEYEVDDRGERMNAKIRDAQKQKIPYMLVVGDNEVEEGRVALRLRNEVEEGRVALRLRSGDNPGPVSIEAFLKKAQEDIEAGD
jgi:threonyl-tRNA synthetase